MSKSGDQARLKELVNVLLPALRETVRNGQKKLAEMESEITQINLRLTPKSSEQPKISDHALVRYLERFHGFNMDKFREEILTPERCAMIEAGVKEIKMGNVKLKIDGKIITTIV